MDAKHNAIPPGAVSRQTPVPAAARRVYELDGRERILLLPAWGLGALIAHLILAGIGVPGLGVTLLVAAWYGVLFWYRGMEGLEGRESRLLLCAVALLALTFSLFSNPWFRCWNLVALAVLLAVQLFAWSGCARLPWSSPAMLAERLGLMLEGLFGHLGAPLQTLGSIKGLSHKRTPYVLGGLAAGALLVALVAPMLLSADILFRSITGDIVRWIEAHVGYWLARLAAGLVLGPLCFGLLYALRRMKPRAEQQTQYRAPVLEAAAPITVLILADALYLFFLAVQFYALFGGREYLQAVGVSYADYARSGFFQLVAVAAINLTVVLLCLQLCKREGKGLGAVKLLATALVAMSGVLLVSAVLRMSLYVAVYGLSFKRVLTYWGMALLAVFFVAALLKIWRKDFAFFKVLFTVGVAGWLVLNYANVDGLVTHCNLARGLTPTAVVSVAWDGHTINDASLPAVAELAEAHPEEVWLSTLVAESREWAALRASSWENWSVFAQWAAKSHY